MGEHNLQFAALVGSRICHDLISPIGAIGNGMELMAMTGAGQSPEMALISESVEAANARIRFFRIAYGAPSDEQILGRPEIAAILRDVTRASRMTLHWEPVEDFSRREVQLAFLAIQCAEQAMPYGGTVGISHTPDGWSLALEAEHLSFEGAHWSSLVADGPEEDGFIPAHVQFLLLPLYAQAAGRAITLERGEQSALIKV